MMKESQNRSNRIKNGKEHLKDNETKRNRRLNIQSPQQKHNKTGRNPRERYEVVEGKGTDKKRKLSCNGVDRYHVSPEKRKGADLSEVSPIAERSDKTMNVKKPNKLSGALTDKEAEQLWKNISWMAVYRFVNRYQIRIAKAASSKKWNLVKKLQYVLVHSYYAIIWAIRRVTKSRGKRTAGIDGALWTTPYAKIHAARMISKMKHGNYKAKPLKRILIPKPGKKGKMRPISIPTMFDRTMQALYALALDPVVETQSDPSSFGFRKGRSTQDVQSRVFRCLNLKGSAKWILEGDIKACFDKIRHKWLMENVMMDKKILKQFLEAGFVYNEELFPTEEGTPQGGVISPILANITLNGLEAAIVDQHLPKYKWILKRVHFIRYADDFVVTAKDKETLIEIKERIRQFLEERGLELSDEKTTITHIEDGFDFLGWNVREYGGKLLIKPSKKSINNITRKISDTIKHSKAISQDDLIEKLNPIIIGWANYHKTVVAKKTFKKLDHIIWNMLWKWAKRRHHKDKPHKGKKWIKNKYWPRVGNQQWIFLTKEKELKSFSEVKIRRHIPLKRHMNPYLDQEYFEKRKIRLREKEINAWRPDAN